MSLEFSRSSKENAFFKGRSKAALTTKWLKAASSLIVHLSLFCIPFGHKHEHKFSLNKTSDCTLTGNWKWSSLQPTPEELFPQASVGPGARKLELEKCPRAGTVRWLKAMGGTEPSSLSVQCGRENASPKSHTKTLQGDRMPPTLANHKRWPRCQPSFHPVLRRAEHHKQSFEEAKGTPDNLWAPAKIHGRTRSYTRNRLHLQARDCKLKWGKLDFIFRKLKNRETYL